MSSFVERISFRNRTIVLIAAVALLAAGVVVALVVFGGDDGDAGSAGDLGVEEAPPTGANAAAYFEGPPDRLIYISGTSVQGLNSFASKDKNLGEIPARLEAAGSPGSDDVAYILDGRFEDILGVPIVNLFDTATGESHEIGPGTSPLWMRSGEVLAYLRPIDLVGCTTEGCGGDSEVVAYSPEAEGESVLLEAGAWELIDWSGTRLLVRDQASPGSTVAVSLDGSTTTLDVPPRQILAASPDGRWLLLGGRAGARLVALENGRLQDEEIDVPLDGLSLEGATLSEAVFSPDSTLVAAVAKIGDPAASTDVVVTFANDDPEPVQVEQTFGARGPLLWSVDSKAVVHSQEIDIETGLLQAYRCPISATGSCRLLITYTPADGALLRME